MHSLEVLRLPGLVEDEPLPLVVIDPGAPVEGDFDARVYALSAMCRCGHDRGEHLSAAPHACEGDHLAPLPYPDVHGRYVDPCSCREYRPVRELAKAAE